MINKTTGEDYGVHKFLSAGGTDSEAPHPAVVVVQGSKAVCREYSLVLEAAGYEHEVIELNGQWLILLDDSLIDAAREELERYTAERAAKRPTVPLMQPFAGGSLGGVVYAAVLLLTAYAAGIGLFDRDWVATGALDANSLVRHEWWRSITALTLHADQQHLIGNLLCGIVVGAAAARLVGPGVAWALALCAAAVANVVEMAISPAAHRAIGASTVVFAMLGLISGLAWAEKRKLRERQWYRWAPVIAGICLLALFGGGSAAPEAVEQRDLHVDVLGHLLGFCGGVVAGWGYAQTRFLHDRTQRLQVAAGLGALLLLCAAWSSALRF